MNLDYLEQLCADATPAPWWNDCGNGQIESRHPLYHRAVVCDRAETFRWDGVSEKGEDPRYECCPKATRIDPECDMEFIAAARNALPKLLALARAANIVLGEAFEDSQRFDSLMTLQDALAALEEKDDAP